MKCADILARQLQKGEASGEVDQDDMPSWVKRSTETGDFIVNEKDKVVTLTQQGVEKGREVFQYREPGRCRESGDSAQRGFGSACQLSDVP